MAVAGFFTEIGLHLRFEAIHINGDKSRHSDRNAVHDGSRMQVRMPAGFHFVEKFGALYGIAKLDAGATGVIGMQKIWRIQSGR